MPRRPGSIHERDGHLYARLTWVKPDGKRGSREHRVKNKSEGWRLIDEWRRESERAGDRLVNRRTITFNDLADHVRDNYFVAPVYRAGRRVSGSRSWEDRRGKLEISRRYFGKRLLHSITWADLEAFKRDRLRTPTWRSDERAIATVNRELATLRRALSIAKAEGWIDKNPFDAGTTPLIEVAHEEKRQRILTIEEEARLLAACGGRRFHLRAILICALDTGMRQGEIFTLKISDVNIEKRLITLLAFNTKTQTARQVPISRRLLAELQPLIYDRDLDELVFGISNHVKRSFGGACKDAGITGLRFHDLRHTAATRWIEAGVPVTTVSRLLGHSSVVTSYRYVNPTPQMLADVLAIFDRPAPTGVSVGVSEKSGQP